MNTTTSAVITCVALVLTACKKESASPTSDTTTQVTTTDILDAFAVNIATTYSRSDRSWEYIRSRTREIPMPPEITVTSLHLVGLDELKNRDVLARVAQHEVGEQWAERTPRTVPQRLAKPAELLRVGLFEREQAFGFSEQVRI